MVDTLSPQVRALLDLFDGPLREVRFPDADGQSLASAAADAEAARAAVDAAERALAEAKAALEGAQRTLDQKAQRSLAYARVYAVDKPELQAALDAVPGKASKRASAGVADPSAPPRRRGRPPKARPSLEGSSAAAAE